MTPQQEGKLESTLAYVRSGEPDLTNRQMALLMLVTWTPGPHTCRGAARELLVSKPVITRATNRLVELGFVRRRRDESDKRSVSLSGTAEGLCFLARLAGLQAVTTYQERVHDWMLVCFGEKIAGDTTERNHRYLEEALELVQSQGCTADEAHQLVDYVYGRPTGEPMQEVGGALVTLAALCTAARIDMNAAGEAELKRIWTKVDAIRAKQAAKPKHSPLPGPAVAEPLARSLSAGGAV